MIFPITYILIILWLIFCLANDKIMTKFIGSIFGIIVALYTFTGEIWIIENNNVISVQTYDSGFGFVLSFIIVSLSIWYMFQSGRDFWKSRLKGKL